jgi:hypothetical protein
MKHKNKFFFALGIAIAGLLNWEDLHDGLLAQW